MKVLYILDSLNRGGAEILALDVCKNAARHGIEIVVASTGGGTLEDEFKRSGVEFISVPRKLPLDLNVVRKLRKIVRTHQIEVVHAYQAVEMLHGYLATVGLGTKRVLSFHGHITDAKNRHVLNFLIPKMDANIIISEALKRSLMGEDKLDLDHNLQFIFNGVDENRLAGSGINVRSDLGMSDQAILMGMVANFYPAPRKDHLTVCKALPSVFAQVADAHFLFVHSGGLNEDKEKLRACVDLCKANGILDRVHFLENTIPAIDVVRALDIFVLSSLHEGLPISVKEAMLLSKPCVLSDIEPLIEISDNGKFGILFKTGDAGDLAQKLIDLIKDPAKRKTLGEAGRNWAAENFSIDAHLRSLKDLYTRLIQSGQ